MTPATIIAAALVGAVVLAVLWRLLRRKKPKAWLQTAVCQGCGWKGQTSRYAGRCPRCNSLIGEQRAKRPQ